MMNSRAVHLSAIAIFFGGIFCPTNVTCAASIPYRIEVLDAGARSLIEIDFDADEYEVIRLPDALNDPPMRIAAGEDSVYVLAGYSSFSDELATYDRDTARWTITRTGEDGLGGAEYASDMEFDRSQSDLIVADEFGIFRLDPETGLMQGVPIETSDPHNPVRVEVDSYGTIIADQTMHSSSSPTVLLRLPAAASEPQVIDTDIRLYDFANESDSTVLGLGADDMRFPTGELYRFNLATEELQHLPSSALLDTAFAPVVDPDGRLLVARNTGPEQVAQVVRIDLVANTEEVLSLPSGIRIKDMDLLVIPEPSSCLLLFVGLIGSLPGIRLRQKRPAAECRR